jgi:predicted nucleotidyltransferase component of viral defense system
MLNVNKHRRILFDILHDIYKSDIASAIGLKGGTMLYFFYGLDRFSVDLDFDLLDHKREAVVVERLREILQNYGVIDDEMNKKFTLFFLMRYAAGEMGVKVDVSKRVQENNHYVQKNFYGVDVKTLTIEDSFAHKLVAAIDRKSVANRDFYDINFLFKKGYSFNEDIIMERTGKTGEEYLAMVREYIEKNIAPNTVLAGLGELLDAEQKISVKKHLKKDLLSHIDFLIT